jgi:hypothetical protein
MKRIGTSYMKRAAKKFLLGTKCRSPVDAVESGVRSLTEWADCLAAEREIELEHVIALAKQRQVERATA